MKHAIAFCLMVLCFGPKGLAQENQTISSIPKELLEGVDAVFLQDEHLFQISSLKKATETSRQVITVINKNGDHWALVYEHYDNKFKNIKKLEAGVFDAQGKLIKKLKKSDLNDAPAYGSETFISDYRAKFSDLSQANYPYTIVIEKEVEYNGYMFYPSWSPAGDKVALVSSFFTVSYPEEVKVRFKTFNIDQEPQKTVSEGVTTLKWTAKNLKPVKYQPFQEDYADEGPIVILAPTNFEMDGYAGNMETWEAFGKWNLKVNEGKDDLPERTKTEVRELVHNISDPYAKVKAIYEYMQSRTRYVSIQLGIGGWQPFNASFVDEKGYGDCKALSNYTKSLLAAAGISSYYALIKGGPYEESVLSDFPYSQFNHVIVCVPLEKDTIWLECTSQTESAGYLGSFTGNRQALLVTEEGGKLVKTTTYVPENNQLQRKALVSVDSDGNGKAQIKTIYTGIQHDLPASWVELSGHELTEAIYKNIDIPNFNIVEVKMDLQKGLIPQVEENLTLELNKFAAMSGKRLFLTPNLMNRWDYVPEENLNRRSPVVLGDEFAFIDKDTIVYNLPENLEIEYSPEPVTINSEFGDYHFECLLHQGKLFYIRELKLKSGLYPSETYPNLREFFKQVKNADAIKLVFVDNS